MIRKSGWLVFIVFVGALLALVYLLAGPAIRVGMVYSLEKAVGAEVNIDKVSLQLAPLAVRINNLQITDAAKPSHNSVSFGHASAALEVWPALLGYYVINELTVDDLHYGAERASQGDVYRQPAANGEKVDLAQLLQVDLPDADELIARANLQTPAKAEALKQLALNEQQQLKQLQQQLPGKDALAQYQSEIKALTDSKITNATDLAAKAQQLQQLKDKLTAEKASLEQITQQLSQSKTALSQAVAELKAASKADYAKVQQLANLSDGGLAGISQILLGELWGERISQLQSLYLLAKPYLPDSLPQGGTNSPAEPEVVLPNRILPLPTQPYPDFWIKTARINWQLGGGEATIALKDITAQHQLINRATQFSLDVKQLPQLAAFSLNGDFAILEQMVTNLNWQLDGLNLQPMTLGHGDTAMDLVAGLLSSSGKLSLTDNQIAQQANVVLKAANFNSSANKYLQQLAGLLNQQQQIPFSIAATGLVSAPDVSIRSSLDKLLGDALLGEAKQKVAAYQAELQSKLNSQLQSGLAGQQDWAALLTQQDSQVSDISASIDTMLDAKLADVKDQAKDKLKDRLLKKLDTKKSDENNDSN
ncbi:TIGR03545 family protein [Rheinheimera maricola]|uniref:TIGR03545 family protein n=1 Tax=Rheinheimera maricola TaxID=2793282 RepID=A0ABS7XB58_9GAMM|nr:TIGR03545 family protein [Rheinheimera maricola]MBZ9612380.1 TIGR03545 family protein [Rheinheimera maricola]